MLDRNDSESIKREVEKRLRPNCLKVSVGYEPGQYAVSKYRVVITDGVSSASREIMQYQLDGVNTKPFLDRVVEGMVQGFATERFLVKNPDPRAAHASDDRDSKPL